MSDLEFVCYKSALFNSMKNRPIKGHPVPDVFPQSTEEWALLFAILILLCRRLSAVAVRLPGISAIGVIVGLLQQIGRGR